jgi:hypothetical protein
MKENILLKGKIERILSSLSSSFLSLKKSSICYFSTSSFFQQTKEKEEREILPKICIVSILKREITYLRWILAASSTSVSLSEEDNLQLIVS